MSNKALPRRLFPTTKTDDGVCNTTVLNHKTSNPIHREWDRVYKSVCCFLDLTRMTTIWRQTLANIKSGILQARHDFEVLPTARATILKSSCLSCDQPIVSDIVLSFLHIFPLCIKRVAEHIAEFLKTAEGFILCYDITSSDSLESLWHVKSLLW